MFNLFALLRHRNEPKIEAMKRQHRTATRKATKSLKEVNSVLTNGFAIKVYHAHGGGKQHGNT